MLHSGYSIMNEIEYFLFVLMFSVLMYVRGEFDRVGLYSALDLNRITVMRCSAIHCLLGLRT